MDLIGRTPRDSGVVLGGHVSVAFGADVRSMSR